MTTKEAIQAMLDGKKVTCKEWGAAEYIYFDGFYFKDEVDCRVSNIGELIADYYDWEIYEEHEPKQTVTIEKWLCKGEEGFIILEGDNSFQISHEYEKVKLLDTYEEEL